MPLFSKDGVNQESISYTIKMDKATITRGMQKLIDGGYVSRVRDEKDKRAYRIYLTQKGNGIKQEILEIAKRWDEILLANLNPEQLEDVKSEFNTMFDNVSEYFKR
jgi:DNA-binding MarR family transcriptional regulator